MNRFLVPYAPRSGELWNRAGNHRLDAGLDGLLDRVEPDRPLLVFTDCLVLLMLLLRWSTVDFWPDPEDVKYFDVIGSCLHKLRRRTECTRLVRLKVKSHSGLLMNDRADALAEQGRVCEEPPR